MSIRLRLTLWHTGLLGLVLAGFATLVYLVVQRQLASQLDYAIHLQALDASRMAHTVSLGPPRARLRALEVPPPAAVGDQRFYVQIVDPVGGVLATLGDFPQPLVSPPSSLRPSLAEDEAHTVLSVSGEQVDLYSAPLLLDGDFIGVLQVGASRQPLEATLERLRAVLAVVVLGAVALAAAAGWFLASKAIRPVDRMTRAAHAIGRSGDLSQRLAEPQQRDELGRLAATFNEMLARLDETITTQQCFLADASHELRTPLAAIRTNISALLRRVDVDQTERDATLRDIARDVDRMGRLVADLLALARADAGQPLGRRRLALDTILLEAYQQEKLLAGAVKLTIGELEQIAVDGDRDRLKQLALNLIDNGLRYTPLDGAVTLDLVRREGSAVLRVRDSGPGIPSEHLPRIFERFYRVDQPRTRDAGGTGLGLAIAKWIAEAHGGRIEVESRVGVGSTFSVFLPALEPAARTIPSAFVHSQVAASQTLT